MEQTMRTLSLLLVCLVCAINALLASETKQPAKIDTLIIEPHEADDLPEAVVAWLEARDYLIPLPWEEGLPVVPGVADSNQFKLIGKG